MRVFLANRDIGVELASQLETFPARVHTLIITRALQDTVRRSQAEINRSVRARLRIKLADVRSVVRARMPRQGIGELAGEISIRRDTIPAKQYPHKDVRPRGVTVRWRKDREPMTMRHWFIVRSIGGHIFARSGIKKRATKGRYAGKMRETIVRQAGPTVINQVVELMPHLMEFSRRTFADQVQRRVVRESARLARP